MSSYTKINIVITIEVFLLCIVGNIIKIFVPDLDVMYIVIPQWVLIITQLICSTLRNNRRLQRVEEVT